MALLLSGLTHLLGETYFGFRQLLHCSVLAGSAWMSSILWLSSLLPNKADAQATVEKRQQEQQQTMENRNETATSSTVGSSKKDN